MSKLVVRPITRIIIALILTLSLFTPVISMGSGDTIGRTLIGTNPTLKNIQISSNSYAELKNINMIPGNKGNVVAFTFSIYNGSKTDLQIIDYWARLQTKNGDKYSISLLSQDKDKKVISPLTRQDLTFLGTVGTGVKLNDLVFQLIKWDFNVSNFERLLGEISIPEKYTSEVVAGQPGTIDIAGQELSIQINKLNVNKSEKLYTINSELELTNSGKSTFVVPKYKYHILTSEGIVYQLTTGTDELTIQPREVKTLKLKGTIPTSITSQDWKLIITLADETSKLDVPLVMFGVKPTSGEPTTNHSDTAQYSNSFGVYDLKLNSVQRMPWQDEDIIVANVTITNNSEKVLPIPKLTGLYEFDGITVDNSITKVIKSDNLLSLATKSSTSILIYAKVPYTYTYSDVTLKLLEDIDKEQTAVTEVAAFTTTSAASSLPVIQHQRSLEIKDVGKRSELKINNVHIYNGNATDLYYAEVEVVNKEKRATNLYKFEGYLKTQDDVIFAANISAVKQAVMPNGNVLVSFWSEIPKSYAETPMEIIIGQGIKDSAYTVGEEISDALIRGHVFKHIRTEATTVGLNAMLLNPYTMSINKVKSVLLDSESFKLSFEYDLSKNSTYTSIAEEHSIVVELVSGSLKVEKEFSIEEGTNEKLSIGSGIGFSLTHTETSLINKAASVLNYKLNIYDKFKGHKRLIGTAEHQFVIEGDF